MIVLNFINSVNKFNSLDLNLLKKTPVRLNIVGGIDQP